MKITNKLLKSKSPCKEGYIWFLEKYGNKAKVSYETLIKDAPREHRSWIEDAFYVEPNLSPKYKGNFKIGQKVYVESWGMGSWRKTKIYQILENRDHSGFSVKINSPDSTSTFNFYQIEDLFITINDLKNHWIRKIRNINDIENNLTK